MDTNKNITELTDKLLRFKCISQFDTDDEPEAVRLAHALIDIVESMELIKSKYLPELENAENEEEVKNTLLDIGDEFDHILYHLKDTKFYEYLFPKDE